MATPFDRPPWFSADLDLGISDPRLVDLYRHWQGLRGDDDVPRVELFDPLDLTRLLGDLFVVRVEDDGLGEPAGRQPVVRYTLIGTRLVEALGRDSTGQIVGDTFLPDHPVTDLYRHIIARRAPIRTYGRMDWVQKSFRGFESIMLPLAGADGGIVKIIGGAVYGPLGDDVAAP